MKYMKQKRQFNLPLLIILSGFAFVCGGFFRTLLEQLLTNERESFIEIFLAIWLGFLIEAAIGMAALAGLLRKSYPFGRLWLAGTGAFALGILIPALVINQFFYALLILPGFLVGWFFVLLLKESSKRGILLLMIISGFLLCQVLMFYIGNNVTWVSWFHENFGPLSVTILMHIAQDLIIGIFTALGIGLMLRGLNE